MRTSRPLVFALICTLSLLTLGGSAAGQDAPAAPGHAGPAWPVSAAFSYQGSLRTLGVPAQGLYDFQFTLHDDESAGGAVGAAQAIEDVYVDHGIFTVQLDFGPEPFTGEARWLQVAVRPGSETGVYTVLSPRHPLVAVPYALYAPHAAWEGLAGVPGGFADNEDDDTLYSVGAGLMFTDTTTIAANPAYLQRRLQTACGAGSAIRAVDDEGRVGCASFWSLAGNAGTDPDLDFLGTTDNVPLDLKVNGMRALRLEPNYLTPNLIGGSISNTVASGVSGATIGGGGRDATNCGDGSKPCANTVIANFGTVSGGVGNSASLGGFVGGGTINFASGRSATVGGGENNTASGDYSAVPGGTLNTASGAYSFAAGRRAHASGQGTFVWADSTDADFTRATPDGFFVRAAGGAEFYVSNTNGLRVENLPDDTPLDNGDALEAFARTSQGVSYAAVYAYNYSTSPAIYATSGGDYSGYFMEDIYVEGNCTGCTMAYVAVNTGDKTLETGDLVAADGVQAALSADGKPVMAVRRATGAAAGVVTGRAVLVESTKDGTTTIGAEKADGPVAPGDHLFIVVYGLAQVRVDAAAGAIAAGQRLTAAADGAARSLRTVSVEGVEVAEAAPAIGTALEPLPKGGGLIWVLVTVH